MAEKHAIASRPTEDTEIIKQFHDDAYLHVDQALSQEEAGESALAFETYEKGLRFLEQGLSIRCDRPNCVGEPWDTARVYQMKMRKTKEHVLYRLEELTKQRGTVPLPFGGTATEMPPSYEEACSPGATSWNGHNPSSSPFSFPGPSTEQQPKGPSKSYLDLCKELQSPTMMEIDAFGPFHEVPANAKQIFSIPDGVQIFFVSPDGNVSAPSYPTALAVYKFDISNGEALPSTSTQRNPPAFLQVGQWVYPLHPGHMPILHTSYGAYMFPDTNSQQEGCAVGLLLADEISQEVREMFEHLMCELAAFKAQDEPTEPGERRLSTKISDGIVIGAEYLSKGMVWGAEATNQYIRIAAAKLREQMTPANNPTPVDPKVQRGLQIARDVSSVAVKVSGYIISQLGRATMALGQQLAPHVKKQGAILLSKAMGEENSQQKSEERINNVLEVAAGGLKGFSTVYTGLEQAAKILASGLISETVQTVNYRYGAEVGESTSDTLNAVGNVALTAYNVNHMGVKAVAKRTAKDTGKALVQQHAEKMAVEGNKER